MGALQMRESLARLSRTAARDVRSEDMQAFPTRDRGTAMCDTSVLSYVTNVR